MHGFVDAGVQAQREAETGGVDLVQHVAQLVARVPQHVQNRAKHFALQLGEVDDVDECWRDEMASLQVCALVLVEGRRLRHAMAFRAHHVDVAFDVGARLSVDHRPHVGGQLARVAKAQFAHGAFEQGDEAACHVVLHTQDTKRRATLPGAVKRRGQHIDDNLFQQGAGVHDHGVLPAGFGDQHHWLATGVESFGECALDGPGDFGGAGEDDALHDGRCSQRSANGVPWAGQQLQGSSGNARLVHQAHRLGRDQRGLFSGFGQGHIARRQNSGNLAGEDGQREIPRADADHRPERAVGGVVKSVAHLGRVITQEVDGFAHFGNGVGGGFAGLAHHESCQARHVGLHQGSAFLQRFSAFCRRGRRP